MRQDITHAPTVAADVLREINVNTIDIDIADPIMASWQKTLDLLAEMADVPAALIMRVSPTEIHVVASSHSDGNPYKPDDKETLGHGLYCETVIATQQELYIPNALKDKDWDHNPDIKLGMIAYCGLPLTWPDQTPFGTICLLDDKERAFEDAFRKLLERFQYAVNANLADLYQNAKLAQLNRVLENRVDERTNELAISVERMRIISRATTDVIWDWDIVDDSIWWNENVFGTLGYEPTELIDRRACIDKIVLEDRARISNEVEELLAGDGVTWDAEFGFMRADGSIATILDRAFVIRDENWASAANARQQDRRHRKA